MDKKRKKPSQSLKMKQKATNGSLFTEPKKDLEGSTTSSPAKVPILCGAPPRKGIATEQPLLQPEWPTAKTPVKLPL